MRIFALILMILFVGFAAVQYNDPDPYLWIPIYLFPAIISGFIFSGRKVSPFILIFGALAFLLFSYFQWPAHWEGVALKNGMKDINIEEGREALGLIICAGALLLYWVYLTRFKKEAATHATGGTLSRS
ncbi:transmembrane 220 family protein [Hymenobacter sp. BT730]|uniref:transmembrane 220 family protein n=1 Tax=Hymenobacter sp. BT730 TaxID=3063332 RepID=UPI0026E033CE|nr:transmembrane 220 family protein [Hymenobacter sp. BT730]